MSKQTLYCKSCHAAISRPLRLNERVREFTTSRQDDRIHIPEDEAWIVETLSLGPRQSTSKAIWFSPLTLTNEVETDRDAYGCCGYYLRDNTRCKTGHIVGSRIDECGYQPRFEPNLKMTYWAAADFDASRPS